MAFGRDYVEKILKEILAQLKIGGGGGGGGGDASAANQTTQIAEAVSTNTKLDTIITGQGSSLTALNNIVSTLTDFEETIWIDSTNTTFIRRVVLNEEAGTYTITNTLPDGTVYVPIAPSVAQTSNKTKIYSQDSGSDSATTDIVGTNYTVLPLHGAISVSIINDTGVDLSVRKVGQVAAITVFNGSYFAFQGITNSNQIELRRRDTSNTQVVVSFVWET